VTCSLSSGYWPDQTDPANPLATAINILPATMRPVDLTVTDLGIVIGTYEPAGPVGHGQM
jgi:hypothetical protein